MDDSLLKAIVIERHLPHGGGVQVPERAVIHCMAEFIDYKGVRYSAWDFLNLVDLPDKVGLSAHVLIPPDGTRIRCRADTEMAWHAKDFNTNSLGVEMLVPGVFNLADLKRRTQTPYLSDAQMNSLVQQILIWKNEHRLQRIDRHSDLDPVRRWFDPGEGFNFEELLRRTWACRRVAEATP